MNGLITVYTKMNTPGHSSSDSSVSISCNYFHPQSCKTESEKIGHFVSWVVSGSHLHYYVNYAYTNACKRISCGKGGGGGAILNKNFSIFQAFQ